MILDGVIFDLDGTLADTIPICIAACREALSKVAGSHLEDHEIVALFGPTEEGIIRRLMPDRWQFGLQVFLEAYERAHEDCRAPFAGIETALDLLKQRGVSLAIVTGKGQPSAAISLRYLGVAGHFDAIETGSPDGNIKSLQIRNVLTRWGAPPHRVAYVGDSAADMRAAKEAGVIALGAAWAASASFDRLNAEAPAVIFRSTESFVHWIEAHVEPNDGRRPS